MNTYRVVWTRRANMAVVRAWVRARDQGAVAAARELANEVLATDPENQAIELSEELYRIIIPPLVLYLVIQPERSRVVIVSVSVLKG